MTTRLIIDTDPGNGVAGADIDDGLAIALALVSPEITLEAITVVAGNVPVDDGVACAYGVLAAAGRTDSSTLLSTSEYSDSAATTGHPWLRSQVAKSVRLRAAPDLHFQQDTALDYAMEIARALNQPAVARDLEPKPQPKEDEA